MRTCVINRGVSHGYTTGLSRNVTFANIVTGDYLIRIRAYTSDRLSLQTVPSQENVSEYSFSFPVGGDVTSTYSLKAAGGVLDYDLSSPSGPIYGLAIWASILNTSTPQPSAPSGNWNIRVTDPYGVVTNYIYPRT